MSHGQFKYKIILSYIRRKCKNSKNKNILAFYNCYLKCYLKDLFFWCKGVRKEWESHYGEAVTFCIWRDQVLMYNRDKGHATKLTYWAHLAHTPLNPSYPYIQISFGSCNCIYNSLIVEFIPDSDLLSEGDTPKVLFNPSPQAYSRSFRIYCSGEKPAFALPLSSS